MSAAEIDSGLTALLDRAFAESRPVTGTWNGTRVAVVPDTTMIEGIANGGDAPCTLTIVRNDGRRAYVYRAPR